VKSKNLVILAAVVIVVLAYILLVERHRPTSDEAKAAAGKVLRDFDRDRVTGIVIDSDKGRVRLEKTGDEWRLREPLDFAAEASAVSSALSALSGLSADRRLPADDVDPAAYGLDEPPITVTLSMDDGAERVLEVGDEMPLGSKRALRLAGADEIVISPGWFVTDLERDVDQWRSHDVTDIREDQVASVDIRAGEDVIRAVRSDSGWQLLEPVEDLGDRDHLRGLISDLASMRIEEFLDGEVDPAALGLDSPEYRVTVVRADGGEPLRLDLGDTRKGENGDQVACRRGDGEYFWASDTVRSRLRKAPVLWRSKKVWPFETWNVDGLTLTGGGDTVELEQVDGLWKLAGDGAEAADSAVRDRLRKLADLEALAYDLTAPMTAETGSAEVRLKAAGDEGEGQTVTFEFFPPLSKGGQAMVRVSGRDTIMGVDVASVDAITGDLEALRPAPPAAAENESDVEADTDGE